MENISSAKIKEIFTSIQGEGPYIGQKQTFIRFCRCNLACKFCDTDFKTDLKEYTISSLAGILKKENSKTLSLTGGEPLLEIEFLFEFLKKYKKELSKKIYLETNGTRTSELKKIIDFVDVVAADIKIESATGEKNQFEKNEEFLKIAFENKKEAFIKVVFDENILNNEINEIVKIARKFNFKIVLQPKMPMDEGLDLMEIFEKFYSQYENVFLIPQVHKFLNLA